jgi:hypothetical protein
MIKFFVFGFASLLVLGCATTEDVQRASDLIRADNELTRALVEQGNDDGGVYLEGLAIDAKKKADELRKTDKTKADAISYYRIAATAFWKSGSTKLVNELFAAADSGQAVCEELSEKAPDRDCLYLKLVIPFAGLEQHANKKGLSKELEEGVDFEDGRPASEEEIVIIKETRDSLNISRSLVKKILAMGEDDRYLTHMDMKDYYCRNAIEAKRYHNGLASNYFRKVRIHEKKIGDTEAKLGVSVEKANKKVEMDLPNFCKQ